ncbi:uncharacterized protein LOC111460741 isoform X1 [Cucurbita moschata]|uniref:Uncharacterized protein LOC111460741 isoform X1 n=1 Tax=Cucurbita moschata TaxID=3662 RepID=A0A6J1H5S3_CUCMO|nr:uncharacterized protein LOC111460741 isoform X1 [Cucurbita moschata]
MDSQNDVDVGCSPSWSSVTNWLVAGGCLDSTVAYESFYYPTNEEETLDSGPKLPLVLRRPSLESGPCEITLHFAEKHEVQQVYVRSTARVYEIYYATNSEDENEYLCTVRCGAALRDEEVLHTTDIEVVSALKNGSNGDVAESNSQRGSNSNTNEDDWVDVKALDGPAVNHENSSSTSKFGADLGFYEATAEITDAQPCTSLTIRLLSLQNKSTVYVDEVYVFANPVDSEEEGPVENSGQNSHSSLMSMLVPTLLQLSKTTGSSKNRDGRTSNAEGILALPKVEPKAPHPINSVAEIQKEGKSCATVDDEVILQEENESNRPVRKPEVPVQVPVKERMRDEPLSCIESILGQLVSRMDRIENCFLRFEENMLRPINSIEGRLKQVEQQLEVLTKESHGSEWPSCYRMSAPSFSANESVSNSFYNSGNDHPSCGPIEPDQKELQSGASPVALNMPNSECSSLLCPSLVVTAPEFSNGEDDDQECVMVTASEFSNGNDDGQGNPVQEVVVDSPKSKPKPSIDDVLASALAQFALSSSLSGDMSESELDPLSCSQETDNTQCTPNSSSANGGNLSPSRHDHTSKIDEGDGDDVLNNPECKHQSTDGDVGVASAKQSMNQMEELENVQAINETGEDYIPERSNLNENEPDSIDVDADAIVDADPMEVTKEVRNIDIIHDVLGFSHDTSVVNFEIPILDVRFTTVGDSTSNDTLKELLGDMAESSYGGASRPKESDDGTPVGEQYDLILVEEEVQENAATRNCPISVDMNYYTIMSEPLVTDGENLQDYCNNNTAISSLI